MLKSYTILPLTDSDLLPVCTAGERSNFCRKTGLCAENKTTKALDRLVHQHQMNRNNCCQRTVTGEFERLAADDATKRLIITSNDGYISDLSSN